MACENPIIKALRKEILKNRHTPKETAYISGYWTTGLI
ncbi:MAG: SIP domain-containing protein [Pseudomonadota bacterium]